MNEIKIIMFRTLAHDHLYFGSFKLRESENKVLKGKCVAKVKASDLCQSVNHRSASDVLILDWDLSDRCDSEDLLRRRVYFIFHLHW